MKWRDMIAAVREHPRLREELADVKQRLADSHRQCRRLEERCEELNGFWLDQCDIQDRTLKKAKVLQTALLSFCSTLDSGEKLRKFYDCVSLQFDADGFHLYAAAQEVTGISKVYQEFPYEDARGAFEDANGHTLLRYLTAAHFGAVRWDIVPGTTYERATLLDVDTTTPEYNTFERKIYAKALRQMGFGELLPAAEERKQPHIGLERKDAFER